jgi:VanZ family protein
VSVNDIVAESLGGFLGVWLWWQTGARFSWWLGSLRLVRGSAGFAERLLVMYLLVLVGYNLLPLDLTLSPIELYHKWAEGRIRLVPFAAAYDDNAHMLYALLSDVAIWIPPALLWKMSYRQAGTVVWIYVVAAATTIELLQLFVYSRVTDTTDIITAAIGGIVGLALMPKRKTRGGASHDSAGTPTVFGLPMLWLGVIVWLGVLAMVFWYPFDFNYDRATVRERLMTLKQVPFNTYYYGSEFRAITEVLHKTGFMLPLGILLGWIAGLSSARLPRGVLHTGFVLLIVSIACCIEFGQLFLPNKHADITDAMLEAAGSTAGYWGCLFVYDLSRQSSQSTQT